MGNRQIPRWVEESEFDEKLRLLEAFFGSDWLNSKRGKTSIFKKLWSRRDYLASTELYTIADALERFDLPENADWLSEYRRVVLRYENRMTISQTYELLSAGMFDGSGQSVNLCDVGTPGYDFLISADEKRIRVSCKKLTASESELRFYKESSTLYKRLKETMRQINLNGVEIVVWMNKAQDPMPTKELKDALVQTLQLYKRNSQTSPRGLTVRFPEASIRAFSIRIDSSGWKYHSDYVSTIFICYSPYSEGEQKRFEDLFRRAASNLKAHGGFTKNDLNVIMLGLPVCVSIQQATEWLKGKLDREHKSIAGIVLNRVIPAKGRNLETAEVVSELAFIANPQQETKVREFLEMCFKPRRVTPATMICGNDSELWFTAGEERIAIPNGYLFQKGEIYHEHISGGIEYDFPVVMSGIHHHSIFYPERDKQALMVSNICPPEETFTIL